MKAKKFAIVFILLVALFALVGCKSGNKLPDTYDLTGELPKKYLENNAHEPFIGEAVEYTSTMEINAYKGYASFPTNSFFVVHNEILGVTKYGVYSLIEKKEVLPTSYVNLSLVRYSYYNEDLDESFAMVFAHVEDENGKLGVYSLEEKEFVVRMGEYSFIQFTAFPEDNHTVESYQLYDMDGEETVFEKKVVVTGSRESMVITRSDIEAEEDKLLQPERLTIDSPKLKDFSYTFSNNLLVGYKKNKKVFTFPFPSALMQDMFQVDKYLFIQTFMPAPYDAQEYTFFDGSDKVTYNIARLDLTNGKVNHYKNFGYLLENVDIRKNAKGEEGYIYAEVRKIENRTILEPHEVLFDLDLKEIVNLTYKGYSENFYKIGENKFLTDSSLIVDDKFNILLDLSLYTQVKFIEHENVISLRIGGAYGLINTDGEILVPFEYQSAFAFVNGRSFNTNFEGQQFLITPTGAKEEILDTTAQPFNAGIIRYAITGGEVFKNYLGLQLFQLTDDEYISGNYLVYNKFSEISGRVIIITNSIDATKRVVFIN